jgi:hypothetical protein
MTDRLSEADLTRMRAEHVENQREGTCVRCSASWLTVWYPCDAARLLAQFAPGPVPHLAGIQAGLFGPTTTEELAR